MRNLITLAVVSIAVFLAVAPPVSAGTVSISDWRLSPVMIGDKMFTLISTNWEGTCWFDYRQYADLGYEATIRPGQGNSSLYQSIKYLVYKVTIFDDPSTPQNEGLLNHFVQTGGACACDVSQGYIVYSGKFDDTSDFNSPLVTFSMTLTRLPDVWGSYWIPGVVRELYVSLTWDASFGYVVVGSASISFEQGEAPVPTENTTWGNIKALYE
jgi:hypothetical protein